MTTPAESLSFPDISGEWAMEITWHRESEGGELKATAFIRQEGGSIAMTVRSPGSDSRTIFAQPGHEPSGEPVLRYVYQVTPKASGSEAGETYNGAAILHYYANGELSGNYWTSRFTRGHFKLERKAQGDKMNDAIDVVLIAAIEEEYDAARSVFSATGVRSDGVVSWVDNASLPSVPYSIGTFQQGGDPLFRLALARSPRMGGLATGQVAAVLLDRLAPRALVMCGVCAGNPKDLALGDIVVSELAYQYDEGKIDGAGFTGDHRQSPVEPYLVRAAEALDVARLPSYGRPSPRDARYWLLERLRTGDDPLKHPARKRYFATGEWKAIVEQLLAEKVIKRQGSGLALTAKGRKEVETSLLLDVDLPLTLPLAIKAGPIASGNVVVKDGVTWQTLAQNVRSVLGLEMEAAAIGWAARHAGTPEWIVMKGVMDHADPRKDDRYKPFAAKASAEALRLFLTGRFSQPATAPASNCPASTSGTSTTAPAAGAAAQSWRPSMTGGGFFEALRDAIAQNAPEWLGVYDLGMAAAEEANAAAMKAAAVASEIRSAIGDAIAKARSESISEFIILPASAGAEGALIAKIWSSHDEYLGQAVRETPNGLGVLRVYALSEEATPSMQSSFAGELEGGQYGPLGVFTFPDHSHFAGRWTSGHPNLGYRVYAGHGNTLACDFYLGPIQATPDHLQPRWTPHGDGIAVDAARRRVRCGKIEAGEFSAIVADFTF